MAAKKATTKPLKIPIIYQSKNGDYYCQLRLDGNKSVTVTGATYEECRAAALAAKSAWMVERGKIKRDPSKRKSRYNITLGDAIDKYIALCEVRRSASTIRGYKKIRAGRFKSYMDYKLSDGIDWQRMIDEESKLCAAKTVKNAYGLVKAAVVRAGYDAPSTKDLEMPEVIRNEHDWLEPAEIKKLIATVEEMPVERLPVLLGLHSLRRSEILGLTWENIDMIHKVITVSGAIVAGADGKLVYQERNKTKKSNRDIPFMTEALTRALEAVPEEERHGLVFQYTSDSTVLQQVNKACREAGVPEVGVHGLRHSFASYCCYLGVEKEVAMEWGGWADYGTMQRIYTHIGGESKKRALARIHDFFDEKAESSGK